MLARPGFVINECFLPTQHKLVQAKSQNYNVFNRV